MKDYYFQQKINCKVLNCRHCDQTNETCQLSNITINNFKKKKILEKDTFCQNYEE